MQRAFALLLCLSSLVTVLCADVTCDTSDLATAISSAAEGDNLISRSTSSYTFGRLDIEGKTLSIYCDDVLAKCKLDGMNQHSILSVHTTTSSAATFSGILFTRGTSEGLGGAMYVSQSTVRLVICSFTSNAASIQGGAIFFAAGAVADLFGVSFTSNSAPTGKGPDIYRNSNAGTITVRSTCPTAAFALSASAGAGISTFGDISGTLLSYTCAICSAGRYRDASSADCLACPVGTYLDDAALAVLKHDAADDCKVCSGGKYSYGTGASSCTTCVAGKHISGDGAAGAGGHDSESDCLVCVAGKYSAAGDTTCSDCPAGKFLQETGIIAAAHASPSLCVVCAAGKYSGEGSGDCNECPVGTHLADGGVDVAKHDEAEDCAVCAAGSWNDETGQASCVLCEEGKFLDDDGTDPTEHDSEDDCTYCVPGKIAATPGTKECGICVAGTYSSSTGSTTCSECLAGKHLSDKGVAAQLHDAEADCVICSAGRVSDPGSADCSACLSGKYLSDTGTSALLHDSLDDCSSCDVGQSNSDDSSSCSACNRGRYNPSVGGTCAPCVPGKFGSEIGALTEDTCSFCAVGKYANAFGSSSCSVCSAGKYASTTGLAACAICQLGTFTTMREATSCELCPKGTIGNVNRMECDFCPSGTYSSEEGSAVCSPCPDSQVAKSDNSGCTCKPGYYVTANGEIVSVPTGVEDNVPGMTIETLHLKPGYWRPIATSAQVVRCASAQHCLGGSDLASYCAPGHEGAECAVCEEGFGALGWGADFSCMDCSGAGLATVVIWSVIFLFIICLFVYGIARNKKAEVVDTIGAAAPSMIKKLKSKQAKANSPVGVGGIGRSITSKAALSSLISKADEQVAPKLDARKAFDVMYELFRSKQTIVKILIGYYQVVSLLPFELNLHFPPVFNVVLNYVGGILQLNAIAIMPIRCVMPANFHYSMFAYTVLPASIAVLLIWQYHILKHPKLLKQSAGVRCRLFTTFWVLVYVLLPHISTRIFSSFRCSRYDGAYGSRLDADLSVSCEDYKYTFFTSWAIGSIVVFPVGVPIFMFLTLRGAIKKVDPGQDKFGFGSGSAEQGLSMALDARKEFENEDVFLKGLSFLYAAYQPKMWWFDVFELVKRLMITACLYFYGRGSTGQIIVAIFLVAASIRLHYTLKPFLVKEHELWNDVMHWQLFITLVAALCIRINIDGKRIENIVYFDVFFMLFQFLGPTLLIAMSYATFWKRAGKGSGRRGGIRRGSVSDSKLPYPLRICGGLVVCCTAKSPKIGNSSVVPEKGALAAATAGSEQVDPEAAAKKVASTAAATEAANKRLAAAIARAEEAKKKSTDDDPDAIIRAGSIRSVLDIGPIAEADVDASNDWDSPRANDERKEADKKPIEQQILEDKGKEGVVDTQEAASEKAKNDGDSGEDDVPTIQIKVLKESSPDANGKDDAVDDDLDVENL